MGFGGFRVEGFGVWRLMARGFEGGGFAVGRVWGFGVWRAWAF